MRQIRNGENGGKENTEFDDDHGACGSDCLRIGPQFSPFKVLY